MEWKLDCEGLRARIRKHERKLRDEYQEALESSLKEFADENERLRMRVAELEDLLDDLQASRSSTRRSGVFRRAHLDVERTEQSRPAVGKSFNSEVSGWARRG